MNSRYSCLLAITLLTGCLPPGSLARAESGDAEHVLWYTSPADQWTEALPLGNGRIGCMVFGGVQQARYQFNEDTLWTGGPHDYARPGAAEHLPEIRKLLFAGKQREAEDLAGRVFMSRPLRQESYQPFGDITLDFDGHQPPTDYRRSLDLRTATAVTEYKIGEVLHTRKAFVSYPAQALVIHLSCSEPGQLSFTAQLTSPHRAASTNSDGPATLVLTGQVAEQRGGPASSTEGPMRFASHLRITAEDGDIRADNDRLSVTGANEATLVLTAATNFVNYRDLSADPLARSRQHLAAVERPWQKLHDAHQHDHRQLYDRMRLTLGGAAKGDLPTDQRILSNATDLEPALATLLLNYGRYLMIASSRPGSQPANLQGIWNDQLEPPWGSKYTTNINAEMNYWLIEPCNLPECAEPLFNAIEQLAQSGRRTAREHYAADGWVLHHNFDLWRGTAPINASNHGIWPTGGAWLCHHLWEHYLHTGDEAFLRHSAYPLMKGAAEFFVDYLVDDPRDDRDWLISGPSNSPELGGLVMGPTMDHQIIRSLLASTIKAAEILDVDAELRHKLAEMHARIAPNQIGRHGQLQEWLEDVDRPEERHRHVSHLWGLHPGSEITPDTPDLFAAARKSLEFRGDGGTGWSRAWKVNFWARLREPDRAHSVLQGLLTLTGSDLTDYRGGGVYPNLFDAHPPFQIDGNFGAANGICEMLVQSHRETAEGVRRIDLLPALPSAWPVGQVSGLRARSGVELDLHWSDGKLQRCVVRSLHGEPVVLRYADHERELQIAAGEQQVLDAQLQDDTK